MGFDMRFVEPPVSLPDWYQPCDPQDPETYQLTSGGMCEVAMAMNVVGLLDTESPIPDLPDWPPPQLDPERVEGIEEVLFDPDALEDVIEEHERPFVMEFLEQFVEASSRPSEYPGRVPAYKFGSNDGWLVTPEECLLLADGLEAALIERRVELVRHLAAAGYSQTQETIADLLVWWAQYNRVAAENGGYRVW